MGLERPLTTQSGRWRNRRNGYECALPGDCNSQLADWCGAQRYFRYVPIADMYSNGSEVQTRRRILSESRQFLRQRGVCSDP